MVSSSAKGGKKMSLIQRCICGKNNGEKRKKCSDPVCGRNLINLRKEGKIKFYTVNTINGRQVWEYAGTSLEEAKASEGKRKAQIKENRVLDIQADGTMLLGRVIEDYLALSDTRISKGKEKVTFKEIERNMRNGLTKTFGQMMAKNLTQQGIIDFILEKGKTCAPATVEKVIVYFRAAIKKAVRSRKIPAACEWAFDGIKIGQLLGAVNRPREFVLTPEQYRGLLENAPNEKYRAIFTILIHSAARKGEINSITWEDVDLENRLMTLRAEITKTDQPREVPLNKYAVEAFRTLLQGATPTDEKVLGYAKKSWGMKEIEKACEKAGIPFGSNQGGVGYHTFRHSWISNAENEALIHPTITRAIAGHTPDRKDSHLNYVHTKIEHKRRGMDIWTKWWDDKVAQPIIDNALDRPAKKVVSIHNYR